MMVVNKNGNSDKKLTTADMELRLASYFNPRRNLIVPNVSRGLDIHECDLLIMTPRGYLTEVEIKISISDLKKDKEKLHEHNDPRIKRLFFAIPKYLYEKGKPHIPPNAGILVVDPKRRGGVKVVKQPVERRDSLRPLNDEEKFQLARLGAIRVWPLKRKLNKKKKHRCEQIV
jgi:hypothetical protein